MPSPPPRDVVSVPKDCGYHWADVDITIDPDQVTVGSGHRGRRTASGSRRVLDALKMLSGRARRRG